MASASWASTLPSGSSPILDVCLPGKLSSFVVTKNIYYAQELQNHSSAPNLKSRIVVPCRGSREL